MNKYAELIDQHRTKRGWTVYELAKNSGISQATIHQWLYKGSAPTVSAIEKVCNAYGITLLEFFANGEYVELTDINKKLIDGFSKLNKTQRDGILAIINGYLSE